MDDSPDLFAALAHPLRRGILKSMLEDGRQASATDLASKLDMPLSNVSYHVRILEEIGATVETGNRRVRGAFQRFYEPVSAVKESSWLLDALEVGDTKSESDD